MTDDLEGRLSPEDLINPPKDQPPIASILYIDEEDGSIAKEQTSIVTKERVRGRVLIAVTVQDAPDTPFRTEATIVEGALDTFSFGKGWLVTLSDVDEKYALKMSREYARREGVSNIRVTTVVGDDVVDLSGNLDFTISYGYNGCTFTVAADEGSYVSA